MRGPEVSSTGAFKSEPRVSSTLSTSSPQGRVISFMSICDKQEMMLNMFDMIESKPPDSSSG